ncbi:MAG: leucine-rich repeat domain-containing protein [Clostridia bacterium]|nr:leucine-rich repeat domain-containing protein [Clostridia bacterium]
MKKKLLVVLLALTLALSSLVLFGCANEFEFVKIAGKEEYKLARVNTTAQEVVIPSSYNGLPVTAIGPSAFKDNKSITRVTVPSSVKTLGDKIFSGCFSLKSVVLPEGITIIPTRTFEKCVALTQVNVPNSVKMISNYAFYNCKNLESIVIPEGVTEIRERAFSDCSKLESVSIPDSLEVLGTRVFEADDKLETATSNGVKYVGNENNPYVIALSLTASSETVTLESGCRVVSFMMFYGNSTVKQINLPQGLKSLGYCAIYNCSKLNSLALPSTIKSLDERSISNLPSLSGDLILPASLETVGNNAIYSCPVSIKCEATAKPSGWDDTWNAHNRPVTWGYTA